MSKLIERYNKQKKKNISHLNISNDPIDNYIEAHMKARQYLEQKQADEQMQKQIENKVKQVVEKEVKKIIEQTLKDLFK